MSRIFQILSAFILLGFPSILFAQVPATGTPPFGSFAGGPDTIDLANLNAHWVIPVLHKAGRGTNFTYDLSYDGLIWYPAISGSTQTWSPSPTWGWSGLQQKIGGFISYSETVKVTQGSWCTSYKDANYIYTDGNGTRHSFPGFSVTTFWSGPDGGGALTCAPQNLTATATDGSGIQLQTSHDALERQIIMRDGKSILNPPTIQNSNVTTTDRNGNELSFISNNGIYTIVDTLGSTALTVTTAQNQMNFSYTAPSGVTAQYQVLYTNYTVATNFGVSGISEYKSSAAVPLISSIVQPDGSQYSFTYEATPGTCMPYTGTTCVTARIASVALPAGGTISYVYYNNGGNFTACTTGNNGIFSDGSASCLKRTTPDGTWIYIQSKGTAAASTTTVSDPAANQTVLQFQGIYETQRQTYQGSSTSGTLLTTTNTCYNASASPCTATAITLPMTSRNVITQLGASGLFTQHTDNYNSFGLPLSTFDYDYKTALPFTTPLRSVTYTYASLGNITAFKQTTTVKNGAGVTIAQTTYNYDQTAVAATTGTPNLAAVTGSRGNLTSVNYPVSSLNSSASYYDTGNLNTATDINGGVTTYNYASGAASCTNSFPTSITEAISSLTTSTTWNCTGGVALTSTDENSNTTTAAYTLDTSFWRPESITDATAAKTNFTYTNQTKVESALTFNASASTVDSLVTLDSLGRIHVSQTKQSPSSSNYDSVETDYDSLGRVSRNTLPYSQSAGQTNSTAPAIMKTYDALGRILTTSDAGGGQTTYSYNQNDVLIAIGPAPTGESTKKRQLEYDALGRLTSVCEITSGTTTWPAGTCGQNNQQTGYWTTYTFDALGDLLTVTQNAQAAVANQQTRTYTYDAMGRLLTEKNPETAQNQISYTYDTDTTCASTSGGDLVKRVDPVGNTTCYKYDALHRVTSITYSGSYAANTPNKYFVYDSATVNSTAMANAKGRLAEAYTAASPTGTKITDLGFSYTARGEVSSVYQKSANSGGYYAVQQTYWPNGALNQLAAFAGLPSFTFNPDGEGRIQTISASTGTNPLTATTFNAASQPTAVTLGSSDSDAFQYDSNTLRPTQYKFNIGSQSVVGNLTWNSNGSLGGLAITDPFNASNTQTCAYSADDLSRISKANCGAIWGQSFTYDPFGNISKSVLSGSAGTSFQPTYQTSPSITNRISSIPGITTPPPPAYDANGNSTNDSFHQYTWDAENRPVSVVAGSTTINLTYDALGRMVEQARGTSYTQVVYSPSGSKLAIMNGTTLQKGFVPLTSGGTVVYNSSGIAYYRHPDWLGSSRFASTPATHAMYSDTAYSAFGEPYAQAGTTDESFTGQDQDTAAGLYDFLYRKYDPGQSRWISPDPAGSAVVSLDDPQSLNRYSYVRNRPLSSVDPVGLTCYALDENGEITKDIPDPEIDNAQDCQDAGDYGGVWLEVDTTVTVNADDSGNVDTSTYWSTGGDWGYLYSGGYSWSTNGNNVSQKESYADCVKNDGNYFSLQHALQAASGNRVGNGFLAGALLGNNVSSFIQAGQDVSNHQFFSAAYNAPQGIPSEAYSGAVVNAAKSLPTVGYSSVQSTSLTLATDTALVTINATKATSVSVSLGEIAGSAALKVFAIPTTAISLAVSSFSAVVCGIGR